MSNLNLDVLTGKLIIENPKLTFIQIRIKEKTTNIDTGTDILGKIIAPFKGAIVVARAVVDTAGTTGDTIIDVNVNGTTIMATDKIKIESGETDSDTATPLPTISSPNIEAGDIITVDVDSVSTTKPQGLLLILGFRQFGS